jgi:hypothetical protein
MGGAGIADANKARFRGWPLGNARLTRRLSFHEAAMGPLLRTGEGRMARTKRGTMTPPQPPAAPPLTAAQERVKLSASGLVKKFVQDKNGAWGHPDWLGFLSGIRAAGYRALSDSDVGSLLEEEKARFWAAKR